MAVLETNDFALSRILVKLRCTCARWYYIHGLFCASHPYSIIIFAIAVVISCCYPLLKLPLPGYAPLEFVTPMDEMVVPLKDAFAPETPVWIEGASGPECSILQIQVEAIVEPWRSDLVPIDGIRSPLATAFDILGLVKNFTEVTESGVERSLRDICYKVAGALKRGTKNEFLEENDCLVISPANLWDNKLSNFKADSDILGTIFAHDKRTTIDSSLGFKDIAFGLPWSETGIKSQFLTSRSRTVRYAVTMVFKQYNAKFVKELSAYLHSRLGPLLVNPGTFSSPNHVIHIWFQAFPEAVQFLPLVLTYAVVLLYLCFSVAKLKMVKSKVGLAISAVITIVASLLMSVGLCSSFGLNSTLSGGEIFPYLIVLIGLENVIVITKSVVSTPLDLDVKFRIAHGLSREGWNITKNFFTEMLVLAVGYLTYVPAIQEFCLIAFVGLLSDMFLQMSFFSAVLSIDIGRIELSDLAILPKAEMPLSANQIILPSYPDVRCPFLCWVTKSTESYSSRQKMPDLPPPSDSGPTISKASLRSALPRRLQIIWLWGNRRFLQRGLMAFTVVWISVIVYGSGHLLKNLQYKSTWKMNGSKVAETDLRLEKSYKLPYRHWPTLFGYYNISLSGKYVSVFKPIQLRLKIPPEVAVSSRHPLDHKKTPWQGDAFIERQQEYLNTTLEEQERWVLILLGIGTTVLVITLCLHGLRLFWPTLHRSSSKQLSNIRAKDDRKRKMPEIEVRALGTGSHPLSIVQLAHHGDQLVSGCLAGQIRIWSLSDLSLKRQIRRVNRSSRMIGKLALTAERIICCLAIDSQHVVVGCQDGGLELYETGTGEFRDSYVHSDDLPVCVSVDDAFAAVGWKSGTVEALDVSEGRLKQLHSSKLHLASVGRVVVSRDRMLTVGHDSVIKILNITDWTCLSSIWNPAGIIKCLDAPEPWSVAAAGFDNGQVKLFDLSSGSLVAELSNIPPYPVLSVCFSEETVAVLFGSVAKTLSLWERLTNLRIAELAMGREDYSNLCFWEGFFVLGAMGEMRFFDSRTLEHRKTVQLDGTSGFYVALPNKLFVAADDSLVCDYGKEIRVLRKAKRKEL